MSFKKIRGFLVASVLAVSVMAFPMDAHAAGSATVSVGSVSGEVGESVTVPISVSGSQEIAGVELVINESSGLTLESEKTIVDYDGNTSFSATFTINSTGAHTVSVSAGSTISDESADPMELSVSSGTVTGLVAGGGDSGDSGSGSGSGSGSDSGIDSGSKDTGSLSDSGSDSKSEDSKLSSNANLGSLDVGSGSLSPAFSSETTIYSVSVGADVDRLVVSATPADGDAQVSVSNTKLVDGDNSINVTVTAPNGAQKVYTINVTKGAQKTTQAPTEPAETVYGEYTATAATVEVLGFPNGVQIPDGFTQSNVKIGDVSAPGLTNSSNIVLFYGRDKAHNNEGWYRYDSSDGSVQLFAGVGQTTTKAAASTATTEGNDLFSDIWKVIALILGIVAAVLLIGLIVLAVLYVKGGKNDDDDNEDDDFDGFGTSGDKLDDEFDETDPFAGEDDVLADLTQKLSVEEARAAVAKQLTNNAVNNQTKVTPAGQKPYAAAGVEKYNAATYQSGVNNRQAGTQTRTVSAPQTRAKQQTVNRTIQHGHLVSDETLLGNNISEIMRQEEEEKRVAREAEKSMKRAQMQKPAASQARTSSAATERKIYSQPKAPVKPQLADDDDILDVVDTETRSNIFRGKRR